MLWGVKARDLMTKDVVTLPADATIGDALEMMADQEVRHLPVLEDGRLVGVVSDRVLRRAEGALALTVSEPTRANPLDAPVRALLEGEALTVSPDTDVDEVIDKLVEERVGCVVVCDGDGNIAGILSTIDILRAARGRL